MENVFGLDIPETLTEACNLNRTALIVYDMQIGVLNQMDNRDAVTAKVEKVLQTARDVGIIVFFMRHMSLPKEVSGVFQLRMAKA